MKKLFLCALSISLLLPAAALAETGMLIIRGSRVNLRTASSTQGEAAGRAMLHELFKGELTPVRSEGRAWYALYSPVCGDRKDLKEVFDRHGVVYVSADYAMPVPAEFTRRAGGTPDPAGLRFILPDALSIPECLNKSEVRLALEKLAAGCNSAIDRCAGMVPVAADSAFTTEFENPCPELIPLLQPLESALEGPMEKAGWNTEKLPQVLPAGQASFIRLLESLGVRIATPEGCIQFYWTSDALRERCIPYFTGDMKEWIAFRKTLPAHFVEEAGLIYSTEELAAFAAGTERFIRSHKSSIYRRLAEDLFAGLCEMLMFFDGFNTPVFNSRGILQSHLSGELSAAEKAHPGTRLASVIAEYLRILQSNGMRKSSALREAVVDRIREPWG